MVMHGAFQEKAVGFAGTVRQHFLTSIEEVKLSIKGFVGLLSTSPAY